MDARDIRTWAANHRAAAEREQEELRRHRMTANEAYAAALALLELDERLNGSPYDRHDPVTDREDREMWETWARLRERWPGGR